MLAALDPRRDVRVTTGTSDRSKAALVAAKINTALEEYWRGLLASSDVRVATAHATSFTDAVAEARAHNLTYRPAAEIAEQPLADIVARVKIVDRPAAPPIRKMIAAVLGGASKPTLRLSGLFQVYDGLVTDRTRGDPRRTRASARRVPYDPSASVEDRGSRRRAREPHPCASAVELRREDAVPQPRPRPLAVRIARGACAPNPPPTEADQPQRVAPKVTPDGPIGAERPRADIR